MLLQSAVCFRTQFLFYLASPSIIHLLDVLHMVGALLQIAAYFQLSTSSKFINPNLIPLQIPHMHIPSTFPLFLLARQQFSTKLLDNFRSLSEIILVSITYSFFPFLTHLLKAEVKQ